MSKERKAPGTAETIVTSEGTYYQPPLLGLTTDTVGNMLFIDVFGLWEDVYQSWLAHLADCGYPVWPNSTAFYLGDLSDLLHWIETHHK